MSGHDLGDMVFPGSFGAALEGLRLHYVKQTVRLFLRAGATLEARERPAHQRLAALVSKALAAAPAPLLNCFFVPTVGAPIHCYANRERWPELGAAIGAAFQNAQAHLLLEMAIRDLIPAGESFDWDCGAPRLLSPSIGASLSPSADATGWRFTANGVSVLGGQGDGSFLRLSAQSLTRGRKAVQGLRTELIYVPLPGDVRLALADINPIAETETHPAKSGSVLNLGEHSEDDWRSSLQVALEWINAATPELFAEMRILLQEIVPVGYDAERHYSASYQEAVGMIYMTLHPNPLVMAEALIHEFQHNKLYLASYWDPVLNNAFHPLYGSPVRPDPRPLWGVLLALHAFLPVAAFYRRLRKAGHSVSRTPEFERRLAQIDEQNAEAFATLEKHGSWTPAGKRLWSGLGALKVADA